MNKILVTKPSIYISKTGTTVLVRQEYRRRVVLAVERCDDTIFESYTRNKILKNKDVLYAETGRNSSSTPGCATECVTLRVLRFPPYPCPGTESLKY